MAAADGGSQVPNGEIGLEVELEAVVVVVGGALPLIFCSRKPLLLFLLSMCPFPRGTGTLPNHLWRVTPSSAFGRRCVLFWTAVICGQGYACSSYVLPSCVSPLWIHSGRLAI